MNKQSFAVFCAAGALTLLSACNAPPLRVAPTLPAAVPTTTPPVQLTEAAPEAPLEITSQPYVPAPIRLTEPGCCTGAYWSAGSERVLYIDKPSSLLPTGIYGVSAGGGSPELVSERLAFPSPDGRYQIYLGDGNQTTIQDVATGEAWIVENEGRRAFFSPSSARLIWVESPPAAANFDQRRNVVIVADLRGQNRQEAISLVGGGFAGWLDDDTILLTGTELGSTQTALFSLSLVDGARVVYSTGQRIRNVEAAPGGAWFTYLVAFSGTQGEEALDGIWVARRDGSAQYRLPEFGSVRWRSPEHLLLIPLEMDGGSFTLKQVEAATGATQTLIDPAQLNFRIAQGEWSVSPDGEHLLYLNAADDALWLLNLPPLPEAPAS